MGWTLTRWDGRDGRAEARPSQAELRSAYYISADYSSAYYISAELRSAYYISADYSSAYYIMRRR